MNGRGPRREGGREGEEGAKRKLHVVDSESRWNLGENDNEEQSVFQTRGKVTRFQREIPSVTFT